MGESANSHAGRPVKEKSQHLEEPDRFNPTDSSNWGSGEKAESGAQWERGSFAARASGDASGLRFRQVLNVSSSGALSAGDREMVLQALRLAQSAAEGTTPAFYGSGNDAITQAVARAAREALAQMESAGANPADLDTNGATAMDAGRRNQAPARVSSTSFVVIEADGSPAANAFFSGQLNGAAAWGDSFDTFGDRSARGANPSDAAPSGPEPTPSLMDRMRYFLSRAGRRKHRRSR